MINQKFICVIDIGSNSFHSIIVKVENKSWQVVENKRSVLRLREDVNSIQHKISKNIIEKSIVLLSEFLDVAKSYNAEVIVVATSALREATNKNEFRDTVNKNFNIDVKILTGEEEAELISFGITNNFKEVINEKLIFDIGGGSCELILIKDEETLFSHSFNIGTVWLAKKYFPQNIYDLHALKNCNKEIDEVFNKVIYQFNDDKKLSCFGVGGATTAITWIVQSMVYSINHNYEIADEFELTKKDFDFIKNEILSKKNIEELHLIPGCEKSRADIIIPGVMLLNKIFEISKVSSIMLPKISIRESIVMKKMFGLI